MSPPALPVAAPLPAIAVSVVVPTVGDIPELIALVNVLATERNFLFIMPIHPQTGVAVVTAHLNSIAASKNEAVLVARNGRDMVGVVTGIRGAHPARRGAVDIGIGVRPDQRGQGVGLSLMTALERWARNVGCHRLQLRVVTTNQPAVALYRKLGFEVEGVARAGAVVDGSRYDDLHMAKVLD
jgi:RimJ/RimL family protein N-acetyltransferase